MLHRSVNELLDTSKINDLIKLAVNVTACHPQNCTIEIYILTSGQFRMKTGANL